MLGQYAGEFCDRLSGYVKMANHVVLAMLLVCISQTGSDISRFFPVEPEFGQYGVMYEANMREWGKSGVNILQKGSQLTAFEGFTDVGEYRVLADGLLTQAQCDKLITLVNHGGTRGSGYSGHEGSSTSPFTVHEQFSGLTPGEAANLALSGGVDGSLVHEYLSSSERSLRFINDYYNFPIDKQLYFHYTHLVKRTSLDSTENAYGERQDNSHPVHADNCYIQNDLSCLKEPPAYTQRDFSAVLYLNDYTEFKGGEFFFTHKDLSDDTLVYPKCGRLVAFPAYEYHAVKPLTFGSRYAVALWFTFNEYEREYAHEDARNILFSDDMPTTGTNVQSPPAMPQTDLLYDHPLETPEENNESPYETRPSLSDPLHSSLYSLVSEKGYRIVAREHELNGPERFSADGLINKEQADVLINFVNQYGSVGDGYTHSHKIKPDTSPFTEHETFKGITVGQAADLASEGLVPPTTVQLYLEASEKARELTERYFDIDLGTLQFDYTHLSCRTSHGDVEVRDDLSHPVHTDNCVMQDDHSCIREKPAYIHRDYSALIYLSNPLYEGGEFFFAHKDFSEQAAVHPYIGQLVGFNASIYHGVRALTLGERCTVALWFTQDASHAEKEHARAKSLIQKLLMPNDQEGNDVFTRDEL